MQPPPARTAHALAVGGAEVTILKEMSVTISMSVTVSMSVTISMSVTMSKCEGKYGM